MNIAVKKTPYIINNPRRRGIMEYLIENDGTGELNDIIAHIVESEGKEMNSRTRKSVYVSLIQNHIPKLEEEEIIKYERRENKILLLEMPEDMRLYFEVVSRHDIPWSYYYLALSIIILMASYHIQNLFAILISILFLLSAVVNTLTHRMKI